MKQYITALLMGMIFCALAVLGCEKEPTCSDTTNVTVQYERYSFDWCGTNWTIANVHPETVSKTMDECAAERYVLDVNQAYANTINNLLSSPDTCIDEVQRELYFHRKWAPNPRIVYGQN